MDHNDRADDFFVYDLELTDKEIYHIGSIIAYWGALESEVFNQTLLSFDTPEGEKIELPKAMYNLQFSRILDLWKERVVDTSEGELANILRAQHDKIVDLKEFRDSLVHGMWSWSKKDISLLSSRRIRKKEIITINFTASDLEDFDIKLRKINFKIRHPGGPLKALENNEGPIAHFSRRFLAEISNSKIADHYVDGRLTSDGEDPDENHT